MRLKGRLTGVGEGFPDNSVRIPVFPPTDGTICIQLQLQHLAISLTAMEKMSSKSHIDNNVQVSISYV